MEAHPHPVHHEKKWKDYLFEFLMLFLAVTAGFFMENQREHYTEKQRVREYARSLVQDLIRDTSMLKETISRINNSIVHIDRFAEFLEGKQISDLRNIDLYKYTFFIDGYRPYTWNRATIEQIKSSGSLRYFTNDSIVNSISAYDAFTHHMDEDYKGDDERSDRTMEKKAELINLNYGALLQERLRTGNDSLPAETPGRELLTKDINQLKILVNQKLIIKNALLVRSQTELPLLIKNANELILKLKDAYEL
jgi:tRNA(Glu) U13 pseudouridine synthase TruD